MTIDLDAPIPCIPTLALVPDTPAVFDVAPLIEQEQRAVTHQVQVTLTDVQWRMLVADIAARVLTLRADSRPVFSKLLAAGTRPAGLVQQRALDELLVMLAGPTHRGSAHHLPPVWSLTPDDAAVLALALTEAAEDPVECACGSVVQQPTALTNTCGACADRLGGDR